MADAATVVVAARQGAAATDLANNNESTFQMDRAYHLNTVEVEKQLFDELVQPIVNRVLSGFNGTVWQNQKRPMAESEQTSTLAVVVCFFACCPSLEILLGPDCQARF